MIVTMRLNDQAEQQVQDVLARDRAATAHWSERQASPVRSFISRAPEQRVAAATSMDLADPVGSIHRQTLPAAVCALAS